MVTAVTKESRKLIMISNVIGITFSKKKEEGSLPNLVFNFSLYHSVHFDKV